MAKVAEYFTLREATSTAARIPEAGRTEIARALALGRQKAEAAEALWSNGHAAEGLRLAVDALRTTLDAAPSYAAVVAAPPPPAPVASVPAPTVKDGADEAEDPPEDVAPSEPGLSAAEVLAPGDDALVTQMGAEAERERRASERPPSTSPISTPPAARTWREVLADRGMSAERIKTIAETEEKSRNVVLPRLDPEISSAHTDLYQALTRARLEADRALAYAAMSPRELTWTKAARIATVTVLGLVLLVGAWLALRTPVAVTAEASDTFAGSPQYGAPHILDGQADTEWLLPDRASGWVEARLSPPRHVASVTLRNAKNAPHFDRATRAYRLELYSSGRVVRSIDGEFTEASRDPEPVTHDVGLGDIDRVRFVVRSHHNTGGGLAEMTIEE